MTTCILENCTRKPKTRGLCASHYQKHKVAKTLDSVALPSKRPADKQHIISDVEESTLTGTCLQCGPSTNCHKVGENWRCNTKRAEFYNKYAPRPYKPTPNQYVYGDGLIIDHSLAQSERERLYREQGAACSICKMSEEDNGKRLNLDHCHETGAIRGLLCHKHNIGLGFFQDDVEMLKAAIDYLNR